MSRSILTWHGLDIELEDLQQQWNHLLILDKVSSPLDILEFFYTIQFAGFRMQHFWLKKIFSMVFNTLNQKGGLLHPRTYYIIGLIETLCIDTTPLVKGRIVLKGKLPTFALWSWVNACLWNLRCFCPFNALTFIYSAHL